MVGSACTSSPADWRDEVVYQVITDRFFDGDPSNNNIEGAYNPSNGREAHGGDWAGLRRKLDYQFPNQRAEVFVADAGSKSPRWRKAGVWYLAGGNTCVYSNPKPELGATEHHVQTSNRRFRDTSD